MKCFLVEKMDSGELTRRIADVSLSDLPADGVLIQTHFSSLNYKDALAANGHPGVAKQIPHVPGIDAAGVVVESGDPRYNVGDHVIATGHEIGVERWGGWAENLRVPPEWLVPLPPGLTLEESMILGTAGFTAAQCVQALLTHGVAMDKGEVVVTGATGGVGCLAVMILSQLGFRVVAVTGKADRAEWLREIGATEVAGRELLEESGRPLLSARFSGGVDTVGGGMLATMMKMISHRGCVACCGIVGGGDLPMSVHPFILRGTTLVGIDSAWCPDDQRALIWKSLAGDWKPDRLDLVKRHVPLERIGEFVDRIQGGRNVGRVVVDLLPSSRDN